MTDIYDELAPGYRNYVQNRINYINSIDEYILKNIPAGSANMIDIGAGDGVRGLNIAMKAGIQKTVLVEPSIEMIALCRSLKKAEVIQATAETIPNNIGRFDVILCLWNVLGHVEGGQKRLNALIKMKQLLSDDGVIFLDVNNRHNASSYGILKVAGRVIIDSFFPDEKRGDASFNWKIGDRVIPAMGHLFTPTEIKTLVKQSGLKIVNRIAVDYEDGSISISCFKGQLLYQLKRY